MAILQPYSTGTVSVTQGQTKVTGSGTAWETAGFQAGDQFWAAGLTVTIATVDSDTQVTLASGWPGSTISGGSYELRAIAVGDRANADFIKILKSLASGNLPAIADLGSAADKLAYFDGAGTADLADFPASARSLLALTAAADKMAYFTGAGEADLADLTAFGRSLLDDADGAASFATQGAAQSLGSNGYQKLPSGLIIQWSTSTVPGDIVVTYPIAFPTAYFGVSGIAVVDGIGAKFIVASQFGKTTFALRPRNYDGSTTDATVFWIAIGY